MTSDGPGPTQVPDREPRPPWIFRGIFLITLLPGLVFLGLIVVEVVLDHFDPIWFSGKVKEIHVVRGAVAVPDSTDGPAHVDAADFLVASDGRVHFVYRLAPSHPTEPRLYATTGTPRGTAWDWSPPVLIADSEVGWPRIERDGRRLHVVSDQHLTHFVSDDDGATWTQVGRYAERRLERAFDIAPRGDTLILAALTSHWGDDEAKLELTTVLPDGSTGRAELASYPGGNLRASGPRLVWRGDSLVLLNAFGVTYTSTRITDGRTETVLTGRDSLEAFVSEDRGATWERVGPMPPVSTWKGLIAAAATSDRLLLVGGVRGLFRAVRVGDGLWGPAEKIGIGFPSRGSYSFRARTLETIATEHGDITCWIQGRARRHLIPFFPPPEESEIRVAWTPGTDTEASRVVRFPRAAPRPHWLRADVHGDALYVMSLRTGSPMSLELAVLPLEELRR